MIALVLGRWLVCWQFRFLHIWRFLWSVPLSVSNVEYVISRVLVMLRSVGLVVVVVFFAISIAIRLRGSPVLL